MLELTVCEKELYDEDANEFLTVPERTIVLEHSLVSVSKWEAVWKKPFLQPNYKFTTEEFIDYIKCMTITQHVPEEVFLYMNFNEIKRIERYINEDRTATTFSEILGSPNRQIVTSELIYYWMVAYQIPMECQKWHLSRLLALIRICNIKNSEPKKMSRADVIRQNKKLNEQRRKATGSRG